MTMSSSDRLNSQQFPVDTEHGSFTLSQQDDGAVRPMGFSIGTHPRGEGHGAALAQMYLTAARENFPDATTARVYSAKGMVERFWGRQGFNVVNPEGPLDGVVMERPLYTPDK